MDEYIKLNDAIKIIREEGIYGDDDKEREDDVINMLESLTRIKLKG